MFLADLSLKLETERMITYTQHVYINIFEVAHVVERDCV